MNPHDWVGYTAALLTTIAFLPQAWAVLKTRDTRSLSLTMYIVYTLGILLWLAYGILRRDGALIAANSITALFSLTILLAKLRYDVFERRPVIDAVPPEKS
jgi:MtN3 and saliva related transmembrane protein